VEDIALPLLNPSKCNLSTAESVKMLVERGTGEPDKRGQGMIQYGQVRAPRPTIRVQGAVTVLCRAR
jgi:hypothetical protein